MLRKWIFGLLLGGTILLLAGCNMTTVDKLYCLPQRSEEHTNLQSVFQDAMAGLEYSAPLSGENRQSVQMADLDGDGADEYILFAKGSTEKPLRILIFSHNDGSFRLLDTVESSGTAFDRVEYVPMNNRAGYEMVVGTQVSDQVIRSLSVFTMHGGQFELSMSANYTEFLCTDLSRSGLSELLILSPGATNSGNGVAELFSLQDGTVQRSAEVNMSRPADKVKRIMVSRLNDGIPAVYVASDVDSEAIITDVFALVDGQFINVSFSSESGTSVQTLRNYYVYADDIDDDGVLELPSLINTRPVDDAAVSQDQYVIRWYALTSDGQEINKMYTYHNFVGGWYLELDGNFASHFTVDQKGNSYAFSLWDSNYENYSAIMSVYVLTGQKREEQAIADNRFELYRTESTIYAAKLEAASAECGIDQKTMIDSFHLIQKDWNTGET